MGLTQGELAERLKVPKNYVSNWERGWSRPDLDMVPRLCRVLHLPLDEFFGCGEDRSLEELAWLRVLRQMEAEDRILIREMAETLLERAEKRKEEYVRTHFRTCFRSSLSGAAGVSVPLGATEGEEVPVRLGEVSRHADEIVRVSGDSMEPMYHDGQEVFIEHTEHLKPGEIGLFVVNGEGYIKQWMGTFLRSLNPARPDVHLVESDDVRLAGRVLGSVRPGDYPDEEEVRWLRGLTLTWKKG